MKTILFAIPLMLPLTAQSPMFRGNAAHTGVYPAPAKPISGKIAWSFEVMNWDLYQTLENMDGTFTHATTPAVVDGCIYVCAGPMFCALDLQGKLLYRVKLDGCTLGSPAIAGGAAYITADDGHLYALDIKDGRRLWTCPLGQRSFLKQVDDWDVYHSSPTVVDDTVFVGSADGQMYAVSTEGHVTWRFSTNHVVRSSPAVVDGRVFFGSFDGKVYALEASTGRQVWAVDTNTPNVSWHAVQGSCAVSEGIVYVGSRSTFFYGLDAATGKMLWRHSHKGSWVPSSPAVRDGIAYVGQSEPKKITAIDSKGRVLWVTTSKNHTFSSPALAGDVLYVATNDNNDLNGMGSLSALDIKTGKPTWTLDLPSSAWASPVVDKDTVYVGCANGTLYAIR